VDYEAVWKILEDIIKEFRRKGETIRPEVMNDLHSAKTLIQVWKVDPSSSECLPQIEIFLENVESALMLTVYEKFGEKSAEEWMKKLIEARKKAPAKEESTPAHRKLFPSVPKGEIWVRIQVSAETPEKTIKELVKNHKLACEMQEDGYMLVFGEKEKLKAFLQKLAKYSRSLHKK